VGNFLLMVTFLLRTKYPILHLHQGEKRQKRQSIQC